MDSFTLNKVAGALLGTCLGGMAIGIVTNGIYEPGPPARPGYVLPNPKPEAAVAEAGKIPAVVPIALRLASADPKRGQADAKVCAACHNFGEGAGAKVGPALYGVVDRPKGQASGFEYSAGLKAKGGNWTFADLDNFVTKPSAYVQGTKMSYPGEADPAKRADIVAYLRTLSKDPAPLPAVSEADKQAASGEQAKQASLGNAATPGADKQAAQSGQAGGEADLLKMIGAADPKRGQADVQVCSACHNLKKGGGALIGPPLYGVVDRNKGSVAGYEYSAGMKAKGGNWTFADLNQFLIKPVAYVSGTKMGYPGEASEKKRAEIIAYLRTLSDHPAPVPDAAAGAAKADDAKAGVARTMVPDTKPGDQSPPPPPNKADAVVQPAPKAAEPSAAPGAPRQSAAGQASTPAPAPVPAPQPEQRSDVQPAAKP